MPGYRPAWYGPQWRVRRPWLNGYTPWYTGSTIVVGLFLPGVFISLVNGAVADDSDYILVPGTYDVYLIYPSVFGYNRWWVSFNYVAGGYEYTESGNCRTFRINGHVPTNPNVRAVFNAACIVAYGN